MQNIIPFNRESLSQLFSKKFFIVIIISIPSAIVADFFKIPLAWMIGPMIATSLIALKGFQIIMPRLALSSILIILGLHIGNYIDQNLLNQMVNWIWTTIIMFFYIVISILIVSKYLQKFSDYNEKTSIFSAAPGALGPLMILAEYEKSDLSQVATAHLIRLIIIITLFPFIIVSLYPSEALELEKFDYMSQNHWELIILIIVSLVFIFFFDKFKVPAALLSGTLVASGRFTADELTELTTFLDNATFEASGKFVGTGVFEGTAQYSGVGDYSGDMVVPGTFYANDIAPGEYKMYAIFNNGRTSDVIEEITVGLEHTGDLELSLTGLQVSGLIFDESGDAETTEKLARGQVYS